MKLIQMKIGMIGMTTKSKLVNGDFEVKDTTAVIHKDYKSIIKIGNITVFCPTKFNSLQRKMIKIFFGFEVKNYEGQ